MSWLFPSKLKEGIRVLAICKSVNLFVMIITLSFFASCGRVYFPIELQTVSRSDRLEKQEKNDIIIIPMTSKAVVKANNEPYKRRIVDAGNLEKPARLVSIAEAMVENYPTDNNPGPYFLGVGDVIRFNQITENSQGGQEVLSRDLVVNEDGVINIYDLGRIKAEGMTLSKLEDLIFQKLVAKEGAANFNLIIKEFNSKKIIIQSDNLPLKSIKYLSTPMYLEILIAELGIKFNSESDAKIIILRGGNEYTFSGQQLLKNGREKYRLFPDDKVFVKPLNYRNESVLVIGETGAQKALKINSYQRSTLSDTIFSGAILNNTTSDFSQIYVLRKKKEIFNAYHLDITNPTRANLASKFEMRPDDIVFVATQPLSLYSRTLSQILGSTGLTLEARDTIRTEIGN